MEEIKAGVYKHFKGRFSNVIGVAKHSDREEMLVVYKGLNDGGLYARPVESFLDIVEDKEGNKVPRFAPATETELEQLKKDGLI